MVVRCTEQLVGRGIKGTGCGRVYDDAERWTICPHGPLWAGVNQYCVEHDLVNCQFHVERKGADGTSRGAPGDQGSGRSGHAGRDAQGDAAAANVGETPEAAFGCGYALYGPPAICSCGGCHVDEDEP